MNYNNNSNLNQNYIENTVGEEIPIQNANEKIYRNENFAENGDDFQ